MKDSNKAEVIKYRLKQAQTALDDAQFLLEGKRSPQSIVNRSYYAMFYAVLALLEKIEKIPSKHSGAISLFDKEFVQKGIFPKELSRSLHKAFEARQVADYKILEVPDQNKAEEIFKEAKEFVEKVKNYLTEKN